MMDDQDDKHNNQITVHGRCKRKMVVATNKDENNY